MSVDIELLLSELCEKNEIDGKLTVHIANKVL